MPAIIPVIGSSLKKKNQLINMDAREIPSAPLNEKIRVRNRRIPAGRKTQLMLSEIFNEENRK
jgi:hypothetical protein